MCGTEYNSSSNDGVDSLEAQAVFVLFGGAPTLPDELEVTTAVRSRQIIVHDNPAAAAAMALDTLTRTLVEHGVKATDAYLLATVAVLQFQELLNSIGTGGTDSGGSLVRLTRELEVIDDIATRHEVYPYKHVILDKHGVADPNEIEQLRCCYETVFQHLLVRDILLRVVRPS